MPETKAPRAFIDEQVENRLSTTAERIDRFANTLAQKLEGVSHQRPPHAAKVEEREAWPPLFARMRDSLDAIENSLRQMETSLDSAELTPETPQPSLEGKFPHQ